MPLFTKSPSWEDLTILLLLLVLLLSTAGYFLKRGFGGSEPTFQISSEPVELREDNQLGMVAKEEEEIVVHLSGSVIRPGVYYLKEGARVVDLLQQGGGGTPQADLHHINLAAPLHDGQRVYIPKKGAVSLEEGQYSTANVGTQERTININTSSQTQLEELPGVGPSRAKAILDYRSSEGPFASKEELMNVTGIGEKTFETLKDLISIY